MDHPRQGRLLVSTIVASAVPPPTAEEQLAFLAKLQRLFSESDFTATYKFALLISLADLALEQGKDDGATLPLSTRQIATRFIELYWNQASPYGSGLASARPGVLLQNLGKQAAVISAIEEFRKDKTETRLGQLKTLPAFEDLVIRVARTVADQPLKYLQNFGGGTDAFLYERTGTSTLHLLPGVAYCLRHFYPLIQRLARTGWIAHIKGNHRNHAILGVGDDLSDFLFSPTRQSLVNMREGLRKLEGSHCFYCGRRTETFDIDHFVPFSLYPRDLAQNFVLAHPMCNRSKSDALAGRIHLEKWADRLDRLADDIEQVGQDAGIKFDTTTTHRVARWAYQVARDSGAKAWIAPRVFETVDECYLTVLNDHRIE